MTPPTDPTAPDSPDTLVFPHNPTEGSVAGGSAPLFPDELPFPSDWDRYEVLGYLGAGGMGHVFRAIDRTLRRPVALKFLRGAVQPSSERFLREARAQAAIEHQNVCRVYEVGEVTGHPYIAMQLVEGPPLDQAAAGLSREAKVALVEQAAEALHAAHRTGLIHRDVKPANILVSRSESGQLLPILVDFGLARELGGEGSTLTTSISGTPAYMAPEQTRGVPVDRRVDVYALGAVLYELLAGEPPVKATNLALALREVIEGTPTPLRRLDPAVPRDLDTIVSACLEKDPQRRYPSARALAEDLRRFLDGEPIAARRVSPIERGVRWLRRRRVAAVSVLAALLALAAGAAVAVKSRIDSHQASEAARYFAGEISRVETETRLAAMVPSGEPGALGSRLEASAKRFERELEVRGKASRVPGLAALGRLALLRGDLEAARQHLELVVDLAPSPTVRADLGLALARSWSEALLDLPSIADSALAAAERERLERELRDPALDLLREGVPEGEGRLVRARLELCAGNFDEAARIAREAAAVDAWRFEARRLAAEAELEAAVAALQDSNINAATSYLASARAEIARALTTAPGDIESRVVSCRIETLEATITDRSQPLELPALEALVGVCETAFRADPQSKSARRSLVGALRLAAGAAVARGQEASRWIDRGLALSVLADVSGDAGLLRARGGLLMVAADRAARRGEDPTGPLAEAASSLEAARQRAPTSPEIVNGLGVVHYRAAMWQTRLGRDPRAELGLAIQALSATTELAPKSAAAHTNLGSSLVLLAEARHSRGEDALEPLSRAVTSFEAAIALDPERAAFHNNRGNAFLTRAEILAERDQDPRPSLAEALTSYQRALALRPRYATGLHNLAWAARLALEHQLTRGENPAADLETARVAIEQAIEVDPGDASSYALAARIEVLAELAGEHNALATARRFIAAGRTLDPSLGELELAAAEADLIEAYVSRSDLTAAQQQLRAVTERYPVLRALRLPVQRAAS